MEQVLRVTVNNTDHQFKLLGMDVTVPEKAQLEIEWLGEKLKIIRQGRSWTVVGNDQQKMIEIAESIGKSLALRYRF